MNYNSEWRFYYRIFSKLNRKMTNMFQALKLIRMYPTYPKYMQRRPCQEIFDRYTYIYRYKDDKDTENFKIFLCALFILQYLESLETTMTITWNKYSKHPLVPLMDYLHHTAETCRSGGVILKLNCDTHLAKLLSTFNFKT